MTAVGFGIVVQGLGRQRDRVLVLAQLAGERSKGLSFRPVDVLKLFEALRVPAPGNISEELRRLAKDQLVRTNRDKTWSVTPNGEAAVGELIGALDLPAIEAELHRGGGALFDEVEHPIIPPQVAPPRYRSAIKRILGVAPFERNVFLMMRFPPVDVADHFLAHAREAAREELAARGLVLHVASDRQADDQLFGNVGAHLWACKYGLAFLEAREPERDHGQLNDNVLIEIGAMLVTGRRCGLFKDPSAPGLPTDFLAEIYKDIDLADHELVRETTARWVTDDLRIPTSA